MYNFEISQRKIYPSNERKKKRERGREKSYK